MPVRFDRVQQGEQRAPGVPEYRQRLNVKLADHVQQVLHVMLPAYRFVTGLARLPTTALIVEDQTMLLSEPKELRKQVVVVGARSAVEDQDPARTLRTIRAPEQWNTCRRRVSRCGRWWNWTRHRPGRFCGVLSARGSLLPGAIAPGYLREGHYR